MVRAGDTSENSWVRLSTTQESCTPKVPTGTRSIGRLYISFSHLSVYSKNSRSRSLPRVLKTSLRSRSRIRVPVTFFPTLHNRSTHGSSFPFSKSTYLIGQRRSHRFQVKSRTDHNYSSGTIQFVSTKRRSLTLRTSVYYSTWTKILSEKSNFSGHRLCNSYPKSEDP